MKVCFHTIQKLLIYEKVISVNFTQLHESKSEMLKIYKEKREISLLNITVFLKCGNEVKIFCKHYFLIKGKLIF